MVRAALYGRQVLLTEQQCNVCKSALFQKYNASPPLLLSQSQLLADCTAVWQVFPLVKRFIPSVCNAAVDAGVLYTVPPPSSTSVETELGSAPSSQQQ